MSDSIQYRENLAHFEGPTIENDAWFKRLDDKSRNGMEQFVNRANAFYAQAKRDGLPWWYKPTIDAYRENEHQFRGNSGDGMVNYEAVYALDATTAQTIWTSNTFRKLGLPTMVMEKPRWALKHYLLQSENWPAFTKSWQNPHFISMKDTPYFDNGIGLGIGLSMSWTEIRMSGGALWSPQAYMAQEAATKMGVQESRRGFLGALIHNAQADDGGAAAASGITGLFNDANVQTQAIGSTHDVSATGYIEAALYLFLGKLKKCYRPGEMTVVSTSGVASNLFRVRDSTVDLMDLTRVRTLFQSGIVNRWIVSDHLFAAESPANTQQQMMMFKNDGSIRHQIIFPNQVLPMTDKKFAADLRECFVFADMIQVQRVDSTYNAVPIVKNSSNLTTTDTGFIPEGTDITGYLTGGVLEYGRVPSN
jgi:hypothetical protein